MEEKKNASFTKILQKKINIILILIDTNKKKS